MLQDVCCCANVKGLIGIGQILDILAIHSIFASSGRYFLEEFRKYQFSGVSLQESEQGAP